MSISISNLTLNPNNITVGTTPVTLSYDCFVTNASDNDVNLTVSIDQADTNIYLLDDAGNKVKQYKYTQTFPVGASQNKSKVVRFIVLVKPPAPVICLVTLEGVVKDGTDKDTATSTISYS